MHDLKKIQEAQATRAIEWLSNRLFDGPVAMTDIRYRAEQEEGFTKEEIEQAARALEVVRTKGGRHGKAMWAMNPKRMEELEKCESWLSNLLAPGPVLISTFLELVEQKNFGVGMVQRALNSVVGVVHDNEKGQPELCSLRFCAAKTSREWLNSLGIPEGDFPRHPDLQRIVLNISGEIAICMRRCASCLGWLEPHHNQPQVCEQCDETIRTEVARYRCFQKAVRIDPGQRSATLH